MLFHVLVSSVFSIWKVKLLVCSLFNNGGAGNKKSIGNLSLRANDKQYGVYPVDGLAVQLYVRANLCI